MMLKTLMAAALAASTVLAAAPARADLIDDAYLHTLEERGISSERGPAALIQAGHATCDMLDANYSFFELLDIMQKESGLSAEDSGYFIGVSIGAYCPEHAPGGRGAAQWPNRGDW